MAALREPHAGEAFFPPPRRSTWWARATYRVRQVMWGLRPRVSEADREEVARWLSPAAQALWQRQSRRDQSHTLRVLRALQRWGFREPPLMAAALLHDVGKTEAALRLWHRVVWVLGKALSPRLAAWLARPHGWRRPFWVLAEHPRLGARLAQAAGCDADTVWLIAHHQDRTVDASPRRQRWLRALQAADEVG